MDARILEEAGLTEKEAKLYLALLETGPTTTGLLIKKLGLHKATVYALLQRLGEKGLVGSIVKGRSQEFQAAEPGLLLDLLKAKEERLAEALPELRKQQARAAKQQVVTVYEGKRAGLAAIRSFFAKLTPEDVQRAFVISSPEEDIERFFTNLTRERSKRGIKAQLIYAEGIKRFGEERNRIPNTEVKYVPGWMASPAVINLHKDTTLINLLEAENAKNPLAIVIKSPETADAFKKYFEALWNQNVKVYRGEDEVKKLFYANLDRCKPGEEYLVLGATYGERPALAEWFIGYHRERKRRGINVRLLADAETAASIRKRDLLVGPGPAKADVRVLSPELKSPVQVNIFKDACAIIGFGKEPFAIVLENPEIADNYRRYFELLWSQETRVYRGQKEVLDLFYQFLGELKPGDEYSVLGATNLGFEKGLASWLRAYHDARVSRGVRVRLLTNPASLPFIRAHSVPDRESGEVRLLPWDIQTPVQINIYQDKVALFSVTENPTAFVIENPQVVESYRQYFEQLWKQETLVFRGSEAVWQFIQEYTKAKEVRLIGARGYYFDRHPEKLPRFKELVQQSGCRIRNIVDEAAKGNPFLKVPGMEVRYLPKEFETASVMSIFGNKVVISQWTEREPIAIHINNRNIHDSYVRQFEALWSVAKP